MITKGFKNNYFTSFKRNNINKQDPIREIAENITFSKNEKGEEFITFNFNEEKLSLDDFGEYVDFNFTALSPINVKPENVYGQEYLGINTRIENTTVNNYLNLNYDIFSNDESINEVELVNYYLTIAKDFSNDKNLEKIVTNNFAIDDSILNDSEKVKYFTQYADTFKNFKQEFNKEYREKLKRIFFDSDDLKTNEIFTSYFPKYKKFNFFKQSSGEFFSAFKETFFNLNLFSKVVDIDNVGITPTIDFQAVYDIQPINEISLEAYSANVKLKFYNFSEWLSNLITKTPTDQEPSYFNFEDNSNILYIGSKNNKFLPYKKDNIYLHEVMKIVLYGKVNFLLDKYKRSYEEIYRNKESYAEPVLIKVEKINDVDSAVINTYYFENNSEELLTFIDTQIKTDKQYKYKFSYFVLVIGTSYSYEAVRPRVSTSLIGQLPNTIDNFFLAPIQQTEGAIRRIEPLISPTIRESVAISSNAITARTASELERRVLRKNNPTENIRQIDQTRTAITLKIKDVKPVIYIFEVPLLPNNLETPEIQTQPSNILYPPATPTVNPIPYKDIKNEIKFVFQKNIDKYKQKPIRLLVNDDQVYDKYQLVALEDASLGVDRNKEIQFDSFLPPVFADNSENVDNIVFNGYEVFRIEKEPFSYEDFYEKLYKTVDSDTLIETLEYNKKYYYIVRELLIIKYEKALQILKSNPTPVLQVEIINNSGVFYPIFKVHEFKKDVGQTTIKNFKKFLLLEASYPQTLLNDSNNLETARWPRLGIGPTTWDKNYKIRLTSKQSGRKIDVNFRLTYSNEEEFNKKIPKK